MAEQVDCKVCKGAGWVDDVTQDACGGCEGDGWVWEVARTVDIDKEKTYLYRQNQLGHISDEDYLKSLGELLSKK